MLAVHSIYSLLFQCLQYGHQETFLEFLFFLPNERRISKCSMVIFNESALKPIHSISRDVRLSLCGFVRHTLETTLPEGLESSGRMAYR